MPRPVLASLCFLALLAAPGCVDFEERNRVESSLRIFAIDVAAPRVTTASIDLLVNVTLDNTRADSPGVAVQVKAYDATTGLLVQTRGADVGQVGKDTTRTVALPFDLPRADRYRLHVLVSEEGLVVQSREVQVGNLLALVPNLREDRLSFSGLDFQVKAVDGSHVRLGATALVTSTGREPTAPLRLEFKAYDAATGLLADARSADVAAVGPDETRPVTAELAVPQERNYRIVATLWDGNVVVRTGSGTVQLAPTTTLGPQQTVTTSTPDVRVFLEEGGPGRFDRHAADGDASESTPGLGLAAAASLLALLALVRRRLR